MWWWDFEESEEDIRRQTIWELIPKVLRLFKSHLKFLYLAFFLLLPVTAAQLAGPAVLRHIINVDIKNSDIHGVLVTAGIYVLIVAAGAAVGYLQAITLFRLGINILTDLKFRMFKHVLNLGLEFHEKNP
ncbi:MAG: ABC transporter transmembrane domain-containing protein, partial [bacterium]